MTAVPIDRLLKPGEYQRILEDSGTRAIVVSDTFRDDLHSIAGALPDLKHVLSLEEVMGSETETAAPDNQVAPDGPGRFDLHFGHDRATQGRDAFT